MGMYVGTQVFVKFGWHAAAVLNMALYGFQLFILLLHGPHCKQYTWFGYEGGLESVVDERKRLEAEKTLESSLDCPKSGPGQVRGIFSGPGPGPPRLVQSLAGPGPSSFFFNSYTPFFLTHSYIR